MNLSNNGVVGTPHNTKNGPFLGPPAQHTRVYNRPF